MHARANQCAHAESVGSSGADGCSEDAAHAADVALALVQLGGCGCSVLHISSSLAGGQAVAAVAEADGEELLQQHHQAEHRQEQEQVQPSSQPPRCRAPADQGSKEESKHLQHPDRVDERTGEVGIEQERQLDDERELPLGAGAPPRHARRAKGKGAQRRRDEKRARDGTFVPRPAQQSHVPSQVPLPGQPHGPSHLHLPPGPPYPHPCASRSTAQPHCVLVDESRNLSWYNPDYIPSLPALQRRAAEAKRTTVAAATAETAARAQVLARKATEVAATATKIVKQRGEEAAPIVIYRDPWSPRLRRSLTPTDEVAPAAEAAPFDR